MAFGNVTKNREGFARLKRGDYVRLFLNGGINFYAQIKRKGSEGIEIEQHIKSGSSNLLEAYPGFVAYGSITSYVKVAKDEVLGVRDKENGLAGYLNKHIRIGTSTQPFLGKYSRMISEGLILNPYVHRRLEDDLLEIKEDSLLIAGSDVKFIMPSSLDEMKAHIEAFNKEVKEAKEKKEEKK